MPSTHKAGCFCGAVEIEVTGAPEEMSYCHCSSLPLLRALARARRG